jgi:hypothetical protein
MSSAALMTYLGTNHARSMTVVSKVVFWNRIEKYRALTRADSVAEATVAIDSCVEWLRSVIVDVIYRQKIIKSTFLKLPRVPCT